MATTVLLVEETPDLSLYEAKVLEEAGHRVFRCSGAPTPHSICPMMHDRPCPLAEEADVIVFSCALFAPIRGTPYRGEHLLRAYRNHPEYSRKPMLIVSVGEPPDLPGTGPIATVRKFEDPDAIIAAVEHLSSVVGGRRS